MRAEDHMDVHNESVMAQFMPSDIVTDVEHEIIKATAVFRRMGVIRVLRESSVFNFIIVFFGGTVESKRLGKHRCKNIPDNTELAVPGKCRQYLRCYNGKTKTECCRWGYSFKPGRGCQRDYRCKEKCDSQYPTPNPYNPQDRCRNMPEGSELRVPGKCRQYLRCYNGKAVEKCCQWGYSFKPGRGCRRDYDCKEKCDSTHPTPDPHGLQGRGCRRDYHCKEKCDSPHPMPDPHDARDRCRNMPEGSELRVPGKCRQYLRCYNGKAVEKCCQWGYSFKPGRGCRRDYDCKEKCDSTHPTPDPHGLQDRCRNMPEGSELRVPGKCRRYLRCYNGKAVEKCCHWGYSFKPGRGCRRDYHCKEKCDSTHPTPDPHGLQDRCRNMPEGSELRVPGKCRQYLRCYNGKAVEKCCQWGYSFKPGRGCRRDYHCKEKCDSPHPTPNPVDPIDRCRNMPEGSELRVPGKCRQYLRCYNGKAVEKCCQWGYSFKPGRGCRRDYHCKEKCDSPHPTPDPHDLRDRCRNMPEGSELRVPGKCRQYLRCYNGKAVEKCCQWGYSFKPGRGCRRDYDCKEKCDSPHPVDPIDNCRYLPDRTELPMPGKCRAYWRKVRLTLQYDGNTFAGTVNNQKKSTQLIGSVANTHSPLVIGGCHDDSFVGKLYYLYIYKCLPSDRRHPQ
ncbi:PIF-like [Octopus vulgaris]|uniref:PIF-like n=1 Tax=Octopus vulgaris TaxID=6645 RepID=A0AA36B2U6_OCTVU|nr:PIF-like [Octopus vulgaris]